MNPRKTYPGLLNVDLGDKLVLPGVPALGAAGGLGSAPGGVHTPPVWMDIIPNLEVNVDRPYIRHH